MITKLATQITDKLNFMGIIEGDDRELFCYGFFILLSNFFCFLEAILFGMVSGVLLESILFDFFFSSLRGYAGGIHARKEITCTFCTTFAMLFSTIGIRLMKAVGGYAVQAACIMFGTLAILLLSPLDSGEKPLDSEERQHFRIISYILTGAIDTVAMLAYCTGINGVFAAAAVSVFLEGILLVAGKIKGMGTSDKESRANQQFDINSL